MTDEKDQSAFGKDILGLVLGAIALFLGVSIVMSIAKGAPADPAQMNQIHRMVDVFTGFVGHWPGLAICLALVVFGVLLFVGGPRDTSLRNLLGILGTGFALAVLFGAVSDGEGGMIGRLGGIVTGGLGLPFGLIFGGIVLFAVVWFAWLRGTDLFFRKTSHPSNPPDEVDRDGYEGVSDEEAQALLPQLRLAKQEAEPEAEVELPPLYPEDVRRKGLIPEGARPLEGSHEPTPSSPPLATDAESTAEAAPPPVDPGGDLAAPDAAGARSEDSGAPPAGEVGELTAQPFVAPPDPVPTWEQSELYAAEPDPVPPAPASELEAPEDADEAPFDAAEDYEYDDDEADDVLGSADEPEDAVGDEPEADDEEWEVDEDEAAEPAAADAEAAADDEEWEVEEVEEVEEDEAAEEPAAAAAAEDAEAAAEPTPVAEAEPSPEPEPERDVTLEPRAAPSTEAFPSQDLVRRAGDLILERQRVAVSLLQRTFDLEFKQATVLLDVLQEQGLIGPYLGGQKRDILLTADEWRARV